MEIFLHIGQAVAVGIERCIGGIGGVQSMGYLPCVRHGVTVRIQQGTLAEATAQGVGSRVECPTSSTPAL